MQGKIPLRLAAATRLSAPLFRPAMGVMPHGIGVMPALRATWPSPFGFAAARWHSTGVNVPVAAPKPIPNLTAEDKTPYLERIIVGLAPDIFKDLYGFSSIKSATAVHGGNLSNTFHIKGELHGKAINAFGKASRNGDNPEGDVKENAEFAVKVTEELRRHGVPCPETYRGKNGQFVQKVPELLNGKTVPKFLAGSTVTLVKYHEKPLPQPQNTAEICYLLGGYIGRLKCLNEFTKKTEDIPPNPFAFSELRRMLCHTFDIKPGMTPAAIDRRARQLAANLPKDSIIAQRFAEGLKQGQLSQAFALMEKLEKTQPNPKNFEIGTVIGDIKPNNFFFINKNGKWEIALAYDCDTATKGPLAFDLARAIALSCFNPETGQLDPNKMLAMIQGRIEEIPLNLNEIKALPDLMELGILISYVLRCGYFRPQLHQEPKEYTIRELDPSLHMGPELDSCRKWLKENDLTKIILDMQRNVSFEDKEKCRVATRLTPPSAPSGR